MTARARGDVVVLADARAVASAAADRIAAALSRAVEARGRADWATTGGSMAPAIYRRLAADPYRDTIPWSSVQVWWGDDRYVPRDHPLSNVKPLDDILLAGGSGQALPVPLPLDNLHPFPTSEAIGAARGAAWCAGTLAAELDAAGLERADDWPIFDLILLGVGADGHLLSVFPGSPALTSRALAMAIPPPTHIEPHVERVTLNPAVIDAAREVLVVATGKAKATMVRDIFEGKRDPGRWPAQLAIRDGATWILDSSAAARLGRPA